MNGNLYRSLAVAVALTAGSAAAQATEAVTVRFTNHMTAGLNEIDVFTVHPSEP
jgi:aconitase B